MEAKKKEHLKLEKNSSLYFVIGLTLILALSYAALEWKTFYPDVTVYTWSIVNTRCIDEVIPIQINQLPPPPPPKLVAPPVLDVVENDKDVEEDLIDSTESDSEKEIIEPEETNFVEPEPEIEYVPFVAVEECSRISRL